MSDNVLQDLTILQRTVAKQHQEAMEAATRPSLYKQLDALEALLINELKLIREQNETLRKEIQSWKNKGNE